MRTLSAALGAVSFLTVVPVPSQTAPPGRAALFFPLVGVVLGSAGAAIYLGAVRVLPNSLAALLTVAFWTAISRILHEDGPGDPIFTGLKGSRLGVFGAVAIAFSVIARWQAIEHLAVSRILQIFIASQTVPRAAMVALAWVSRPVGTGQGLAFSSTLTTSLALAVIVQGIVAAIACGIRPGLMIVLGAYLAIRFARWYFYRRIGGVNGDSLGITEQILEIFVLALFTCRNCAW